MDENTDEIMAGMLGRGSLRIQPVNSSLDTTTEPRDIGQMDRIICLFLLAIAMYNSIELLVIIFYTRRQRQGLYFGSLLVSNCGITVLAVGIVLHDFGLVAVHIVAVIIQLVGWTAMVGGQSRRYSQLIACPLYLVSYSDFFPIRRKDC